MRCAWANRAASKALRERGRSSGDVWTWISMAPASICVPGACPATATVNSIASARTIRASLIRRDSKGLLVRCPASSTGWRFLRTRCVRQLLIQRLTVANTAAHELRPFRHHGQRILPLGQESPKCRMMPTQLVTAAVAMRANAAAEAADFGDELVT